MNQPAGDFYPPSEPALQYFAPQPVDRTQDEIRFGRFPPAVAEALAGQIGPLANLRSSSGCAIHLRTDSPIVRVHLRHLRHHQMIPVGIALEAKSPDGSWREFSSEDLRERSGDIEVEFATGFTPGEDPRETVIWLPLISTCAFGGVTIDSGSRLATATVPEPRWLVIGDSLAQGFSVQSPLQCWVHRLSRRWNLPAMNLGVGGLKIEPEVVRWALAAKKWDLVTISLGSNHCWRDADAETVAERARELAEIVLSGGHARVAWLLPPYKPCEDGKGPSDFSGVPLNRETGERIKRVRECLHSSLAPFQARMTIIDDLLPHDYRLFPDGLHPFAFGHAVYADNLDRALHA